MKYTVTRAQVNELRRVARAGNKVAAIKKLRSYSGAGLKESKALIEADYPIPCTIDGVSWEWEGLDSYSVSELMNRLFELTVEIAEVHRVLKEYDTGHEQD